MSDEENVNWGALKKYCDEKQTICRAISAPKNKISMAVMIGSTVLAATGAFFYISAAEIKDHELRESTTYITRSDSQAQFVRIESRVERVEQVVGSSNEILKSLDSKIDRNLAVIKAQR